MTAANLEFNLDQATIQFRQARADTQLMVLYSLVQRLHRVSRTATPTAFFSQKVQAVLKQLQQLPRPERHQALEEILMGVPTRLTEAYEDLDINMRMAFWYRLVNGEQGDTMLPQPQSPAMAEERRQLLAALEQRDSNELVALLREAVQLP